MMHDALHPSIPITRSTLVPYPLATDHGVWFRRVSMTLLMFRPALESFLSLAEHDRRQIGQRHIKW